MKTEGENILFDVCMQVIKTVNKYLLQLDDNQRYDLFSELSNGYCRYCGAKLPCFCCRDE